MSDPQKTAVAPQKTAVAPQKTAVAPQKTSVASCEPASPKVMAPPSLAVSSGAEAEILIVMRGDKHYALKRYNKGFHPNAKVLDALKHLGGKGYVADIYETGVTPEGQEYELMEYLPAGSLARYDLRGDAAAITTIVLRMAIALDACHRSRVIHKDVKPANILVRNTSIWDCALCDFGIADIMNDEGKCITKQSRTPIYAAPEIYDPACAKARIDGVDLFEITPAADFYSLGMTALCLWSGEDAFAAAEDKMAIEKLGPGISVPGDMPARLRRIVAGLLEKNPSRRWRLKDIETCLGGHWAVMHTLNPLSDVRLNSNPASKDYAMTGETIGAFLNKVYMWQFADAKAPADAKMCQAIVDSFSCYEDSYMQLFFAGKGDRFKEQDSWMSYCCDWESEDNEGKAGPQDEDTRLEISMMKTIKGFGFTPYYEFEDDTVTCLEDLENVDDYDKKYGLSHGLKGWLAVQCHEDPDADLSEDYAYEQLLNNYLEEIEKINPDEPECCAFRYALVKACDLEDDILKTMRKNSRAIAFQTILSIILVLMPMIVVAIWAYCSLERQPKLLYFPVLAAALAVVVVNVVKVLAKRYSYSMTYTVGGANTDSVAGDIVRGIAPDVTADELLVEPLYYAFNDEEDFDSSLNGIIDNSIYRGWDGYVKSRRKKTFKHILLSAAVLVLALVILPVSDASGVTNPQSETTEINEQVQ